MTDLKMIFQPDITKLNPAPCAKLNDWLIKPFNLSHALKKHCNELTLRVLSQCWCQPDEHERAILCLKPNESVWLRKSALLGDNNPFTYARVVIPKATYTHYQSAFESLDNKLIGETLLYNNIDVTRGAFEYAVIDSKNPLMQEIQAQLKLKLTAPIWARRSVFSLKDLRMLICEYYLPFISTFDYE